MGGYAVVNVLALVVSFAPYNVYYMLFHETVKGQNTFFVDSFMN